MSDYQWPRVIENDDGIRPAGLPDRCFFCEQKIGNFHKTSCVTIQRAVEYDVLIRNQVVGKWSTTEPYSWNKEHCEQHRNLGTWCKDNAVDSIEWTSEQAKLEVDSLPDEQCTCGLLEFRVSRMIDGHPIQPPPHI